MNQSDDLIKSAQFNYMFQLDWLVSQYPFKFRQCPLTIGDSFFSNQIYSHLKSSQTTFLAYLIDLNSNK